MAFFTGNVFDAAKKMNGKTQAWADQTKEKFAAIRAQRQGGDGSGGGDPTIPATPITPTTPFSPLASSTPTVQQQLNGQAEQNLLGGGNVINDRITGDAFNAAAIQQRQGLARYEQNQRAQNAQQIHQAGFAGTPIGVMYANATEADLARNRFDTNLGIEVARQDARMQGAQAAQDYANNVNRFQTEQQTNRWAAEDRAGSQFIDTIYANPDWKTATEKQLANDPEFMRVAQADWEAKYGPMAGPVNMGWAMDRVAAANDPRLTNANVKIQEEWNNYIDTIPNLTDEYKSTLKMLPLIASGEIFGAKITQGDDGNLQVEMTDDPKTSYVSGSSNPWTSDAAKKILGDDSKAGTEEYNAIIGDMANDISTGKYTPVKILDLDTKAKAAVIQELNGMGLVSTSGSGQNKKDGKGYHYYPNWNTAYKNKQIITIEGRPAYITNVEKGNTNANEWTKYSITYLDGDEPKTDSKRAASNSSGQVLGGVIGGIIGTMLLPGVGTAAGAAVGAWLGENRKDDSVSAEEKGGKS